MKGRGVPGLGQRTDEGCEGSGRERHTVGVEAITWCDAVKL